MAFIDWQHFFNIVWWGWQMVLLYKINIFGHLLCLVLLWCDLYWIQSSGTSPRRASHRLRRCYMSQQNLTQGSQSHFSSSFVILDKSIHMKYLKYMLSAKVLHIPPKPCTRLSVPFFFLFLKSDKSSTCPSKNLSQGSQSHFSSNFVNLIQSNYLKHLKYMLSAKVLHGPAKTLHKALSPIFLPSL